MNRDRRRFLAGGLAAGLYGLSQAGELRADRLDRSITDELKKRLKFLSPPDGAPGDRKFGVPKRSPQVTPFTDPLFIPPVAQPVFTMTDPPGPGESGQKKWRDAFEKKFKNTAEEFRKKGVEIGGLPDPAAHQRFFEFWPRKFYVIREREFPWYFHSDYNAVAKSWSWGYEDLSALLKQPRGTPGCPSSPGPTFVAHYGEPILVRRINDLPEVGNDRGSAHLSFALPSTTTHLHNAHTASESDGNPSDWINPGEYWDHHYGNFPSGHDAREKLSTLWYHDHRMDYTAANVYSGLDGFYLLFDELKGPDGKPYMGDVGDETKGWRLPSGRFDVPLMLHDLLFACDDGEAPQLAFDGYNIDGILGDRYTVNRRIQPYFQVEPRKYRFRIVNGGPSRFYELALHSVRKGHETKPFVVVTGDGNFQPSPLLVERIYLGVAQRVDVVVDFSQFRKGDHVYFVNHLIQIRGQGPTGRTIERPTKGAKLDRFFNENAVMRFDIVAPKEQDQSRIRLTYRELPPVDLTEVVRERLWEFDHDGGLWTINGRIFDPNRIDAGIEEGTAEIWTFRNMGNGWHHPIHSHFTEFIILEIDGKPFYQGRVQVDRVLRRPEDSERSLLTPQDMANTSFSGLLSKDFKSLAEFAQFIENDPQLKKLGIHLKLDRFLGGPRRDVALLLPGTEVKVFMRWKDFRGKYVMHCHNVVHEDHAMMIRWDIVPRGEGFDTPRRARTDSPEPPRQFVDPHPGQSAAQEGTIRSSPLPQEAPR